MDIVLATKNEKKAEEMRKILNELLTASVNVLTLNDFPGCPDVTEDGSTFGDNAVKKAIQVSRHTGLPAAADDSGLEVDALHGAPGVFSARYAGASASDSENVEKLMREMENIPDAQRSARFVCCIAFAFQGSVKTFYGYVRGRIGREPRGEKGFGYDPVFYPEGSDRTFAEMSEDEKSAISHRGIALRELQNFLRGEGMA